jgi:hypothetical protein
VIIAVSAMVMVQVTAHQIINVVAVRCSFVPAIGAMSVVAAVRFAVMRGCAAVRIGIADGNDVLVNVVAVHVVHVAIMKVVGMAVMANSHVPASAVVDVRMRRMRFALSVLHTFPFEVDVPILLATAS